jgi:hypothetical protein
MKMEMEGREPLIVLFGVPILTTAIVLASMYLTPWRLEGHSQPPPQVTVQPNINVTPRITAEMPAGAIRNEVTVPPAQIHEVIKEVVKVPDVKVFNKVEPNAPTPVQVNVPRQETPEPRIVVLPTLVPMPFPTPVAMEPAAESAEGKPLPPPKGTLVPSTTVGGPIVPR